MKPKYYLLAILFLPLSLIAQIPLDGLVAYYPFNGNANDESGNENHGIVVGPIQTYDRFGNINSAYLFDGIDDGIIIENGNSTNLETFNNGYTLVVWAYPFQAESGYHTMISRSNTFIMRLSQLRVESCHSTSVSVGCLTSNKYEIQENNWSLIVVTWDGPNSQAKLYLNGDIIASNSFSDLYTEPDGLITIGKESKLERWFFGGILDDICIYNRSLSSDEISTLYTENQCFETVYDTLTTEVFDTTYVTINDTVTVEVYDTTYISVTDTLIIDVDFTGYDPPRENNTIKVYPNPANHRLYIHTGNYTDMDGYSMKIVNNLGAVVFETAIEQELYEVDLSTWGGAGLYVIQLLESGGDLIDTRKIILYDHNF